MSNRFSLDHLASFSLAGPDARAYAQSQFTVSVDALSRTLWSPLAWCDPKGRVLAFMMGRAGERNVDLVAPAAQAESVRERLERFTIGRRVDVSETKPVAGLFGTDDQVPALSIDSGRGMLAGVQAPADPEGLLRWRQLDLCAGLPWLAPASAGQHLPQWLGLEELGALAYDKGCYPGQEVIARLHYRGSVKYRLVGLTLDTDDTIEAHSPIVDPEGKAIGYWLDGLKAGASSIGLGVVSTRVGDAEQVSLRHGERAHLARVTAPETLC